MEKDKRIKLYFLISVILVFFSGGLAYGFQTHFGTIDVQEVAIADETGNKIVAKLYRPIDVSYSNPAPGVLAIHGYNNDKDVQRPASLELAKAGFVVLAIDRAAHGDSEGDQEFQVGCLDAAYKWLAGLAFVDGTSMGLFGHSMGYILGSAVAAMNPDHDACVFETFPPFLYNFTILHNVLHIWSQYEEFYTLPSVIFAGTLFTPFYTEDMTTSEVFAQGMTILEQNAGVAPGTGAVDTTYGNFGVGDAYREHYCAGLTHPGQTMDQTVTAEIVAWMLQALMGETEGDAWNTAAIIGQTYLGVEICSGLALLFTFMSVVFLTQILLKTKSFKEVQQPMPERVVTKKKYQWWIFAGVNTVLAAVFFGLFTHADENWSFATNAEPLKMGMMNNWLGFYLMTAAVAVLLVGLWYILFNKKDRGSITPYDLGVSYDSEVNMDYMQGKTYNWGNHSFYVGIIVLVFPIMSQIFSAFDSFLVGWGDWLLIPWWGLWLIISSILVILGIAMLFTKLKEKKLWKRLGVIILLVGAFFGWMTMHVLGYLWWAYWLFIPAFAIMFVGVMLTTNLKKKRHWGIFGKTVILALLLFAWMYILVSIFQTFFLIEFRIFWSFAKMFTPQRFIQFLMYLPIFLPFFLLNGGVFLFGQIRQEESSSSIKTHIIWWLKTLFAMLAGLLVLFLIQYIGVAITNYPLTSWPGDNMMPIQLMGVIPLSGLVYFIMIIFYRKTGKIYLGSIFGAIITVWFLSVGTVFSYGI